MADKDHKIQLDWGVIFKYGVILFLIALVCTLLLALTNRATAPVIAQRNEQANIEAQRQVMPEADKFEDVKDLEAVKKKAGAEAGLVDAMQVAYKGNDVVGYTVRTLPSGYGGEITLLTGIDTQGKITGIYVLEQSETAGLGAKSTTPEFQDQYKGLSATEPVTVVKSGASGNQIQAISGATITSNAVTTGVNASEAAVKAAEEL